MFLLNMFLVINFLLVVSLYHPFSETSKYHSGKIDWKIRNFNSQNGKSLYIRRVVCLGKNGEMIESHCCTDNHPKPWLILLPTKHKTRCYRPSCQHLCYLAIIEFRKSISPATKATTNTTTLENNDYYYENENAEYNPFRTNNKKTNSNMSEEPKPVLMKHTKKLPNLEKIESNDAFPPKVAVPEANLEFLDVCKYKNNTNLLQLKNLCSLCKMKNMYLNDLLQHINYINNENKKTSFGYETDAVLLYQPINEKDSTERLEQTKEGELDVTENNYDEIDIKEFTDDTIKTVKQKNVEIFSNLLDYHSQQKKIKTDPVQNSKPYTKDKYYDLYKYWPKNFEEVEFPLKTEIKFSNNGSSKNNFKTIANISTEKNIAENKQLTTDSCCTCTTCNFKGRLKDLIMVLLRRPRPIFANKTNFFTRIIYKAATTELQISSNTDVPSCTMLIAEKPSEKITSIESYKIGESVEQYVKHIDNKCSDMYKEYKITHWDYETNVTHFTTQRAMTTSLQFNQLLQQVNKKFSKLIKEPLMDPKLQRQIKLLFLPGMNSLPEIKSNEFEQVLYAMRTIYSTAMVSKWNQPSDKVLLNPVITDVMAYSKNPDELKYYWIEWRKATGKRMRPLFEQYVSLQCLAAKTNGFNDASEMWTRHYESEDLIDTLSVHWETVKPLYMELHAYIRHTLHGLYGNVVSAKNKGKIPAHLTGDIWSKNWKNLYCKVMPFDVRGGINIELQKEITPHKLTEKAEEFFLSMGFTQLPQEFWKNSILTKTNNTMLCEPSAWDMGNSMDFRIKLCATPNIQDLFDIHHVMSLTEYFKEYRRLPFAFRSPANPGFAEGVAGAVVLSAHTDVYLKSFGILKKGSEEGNINKLLSIALEKVAFIPYSYILILWRNKVFSGEISAKNYNSEWWKMRSQYQGICPPIERTEDDFDVGSKQHIAANQPYIKYFLGTILQFQFYEVLCKKANFKGILHECDLKGSTAAGSLLKNMMSMGSSYHWKVALQELTGIRKIDSKPLVRYFEPLLKWLQKNNRDKNVKVGWEDD